MNPQLEPASPASGSLPPASWRNKEEATPAVQAQPSSRGTPGVSGRAPLPILLFSPRLPNSLSGTQLPSLGVRQEETRSRTRTRAVLPWRRAPLCWQGGHNQLNDFPAQHPSLLQGSSRQCWEKLHSQALISLRPSPLQQCPALTQLLPFCLA